MKKFLLILLCLAFVCGAMTYGHIRKEASVTMAQLAEQAMSDIHENSADANSTTAEASSTSDVASTPTPLSIAVSTKGYNPYITTDMLVEQSASLLFESFVTISPDFELEYRLAKEVVCSGTTVTITMRSDCYFADGTFLTVADAFASLSSAKASETYATRFANLLKIDQTDTALVLTLAKPDSMFAYLLDIPVLKAADIASTTPTPSGRYTYGTAAHTFTQNIFAPFPSDGARTIEIVPVRSYDEMMNELAMSNVNYAVQREGTGGESLIAASEHYYKSNILLFLGVNAFCENPLCNTASGRILLSNLTDRTTLSTVTYNARAYPARGALNPFYPVATGAHTTLATADESTLVETMTTLGYTYNEDTARYQNAQGETAQVSLLVYAGTTYKILLARELQAQWAKYGIEMTINTATDFNSFLTLLQTNEFELYIGEMKLYNNMELSSFWQGSASYGVSITETFLNAYSAFRADTVNAVAFETAFSAEMPYLPLLWHNGVILTTRGTSGVSSSVSDPFYALGELQFSDEQQKE